MGLKELLCFAGLVVYMEGVGLVCSIEYGDPILKDVGKMVYERGLLLNRKADILKSINKPCQEKETIINTNELLCLDYKIVEYDSLINFKQNQYQRIPERFKPIHLLSFPYAIYLKYKENGK